MKVVVRTVQHESALEASPKTSVKEIFNLICKSLGIQETWYFGLMYYGPDSEEIWIDQSKKTLKDLRHNSTNLHFKVKFYPEDIGEELIEAVTIDFFFLQVKSAVLKDEIYCPADTCVLLASYALQAKYGDYNKDEHNEDILKRHKLLPERVTKQHALNTSDWHVNITSMWIKHNGLDKEEAMLEYLKLVQNLEMYGVTYFNIKNRKGTDVILGVTALGLNIYKEDDRLNPTVAFPWSEIKNLKFKDKKFIIKPADKSAKDFIFFTHSGRMSKYILNLGIGNHSLYVRRRKPDTPEVAKMKEKANEKTIQKLQQQLDELQKSKEELEEQRNELRNMMQRLEESKNMESAERQKLEDEINAKHAEVLRIQEEVERKDAEAKRLQDEEKRRGIEEETRRRGEKREEEERQRQEEQELETLPEGADTSLPELQQVNEQLKEQLKQLQGTLEGSRHQEEETTLDKIHRINLLEGRDKYKTLADIRRGNTIRRVEMFENM
ncbi:hypothetical protein NQ317_012635 [Molorchus minor]|uniref:Moesin/ezrin/radixin homolog 1 n=1 Tax=Molorchus minor TaxID=1323400 RepID=A0ABQ9J4M3_9CUCU|nr:hypothetical protein NQ317_012635 [Molorchus minor]